MKKINAFFPTVFLILLFVSSCFPVTDLPTQDSAEDLEATSVAGTLYAYMTEFARYTKEAEQDSSQVPEGNLKTPSLPTETLVSFSRTPSAPLTPTPSQTNTLSPSATSTLSACNWAQFVDDVTIPDGTEFTGNEQFTKIWRLKNIGSCEWNTSYDLIFTSGNPLGGPAAISLEQKVKPGETIDLSVDLVAPNKLGDYKGYWKLRSDTNINFGLGVDASSAFWVDISVNRLASTPDPDLPLDFAASFCSASWSSAKRDTLACPSAQEDFTNGSIQRDDTPRIEISYEDNEVALIMIPSDGTGGMISGSYPAVNVQKGDHFSALTGCMSESENCTVTFQLNYSADDGPRQNLQTWTETYDGNHTRVNIDLSSLAGESVIFVLQVSNNNDSSDGDRAFWMVPRIVR
jgi:hypothetical protein